MGRIGEPKREIHIPVPPPATPLEAPAASPSRPTPAPSPSPRPSRWPGGGAVSLPWDVFATPIAARKLARLGVEQDRVVLRPAFYRQLGEAYGALAHATCALADHDAPDSDCSCGFYAVADESQLWRLGADEPELAVLDVELAGRVIEHDHGYRASRPARHARALPRRVRPLRQAGRHVRAPPLRWPRPVVPALRAAVRWKPTRCRRRSRCR